MVTGINTRAINSISDIKRRRPRPPPPASPSLPSKLKAQLTELRQKQLTYARRAQHPAPSTFETPRGLSVGFDARTKKSGKAVRYYLHIRQNRAYCCTKHVPSRKITPAAAIIRM